MRRAYKNLHAPHPVSPFGGLCRHRYGGVFGRRGRSGRLPGDVEAGQVAGVAVVEGETRPAHHGDSAVAGTRDGERPVSACLRCELALGRFLANGAAGAKRLSKGVGGMTCFKSEECHCGKALVV